MLMFARKQLDAGHLFNAPDIPVEATVVGLRTCNSDKAQLDLCMYSLYELEREHQYHRREETKSAPLSLVLSMMPLVLLLRCH